MPLSDSKRPRPLGTIKLDDGRAPLLVRFTDRDAVPLEEIRSGGVIFTRVEEMPLLEDLLEQHRVVSAVLEAGPGEADDAPVFPPHSDWRDRARARLNHQVLIREGDEVMDADYALLAVMSEDELELFLEHAHRVLDDSNASSQDWLNFLEEEELRLRPRLAHEALSPLTDNQEEEIAEHQSLLSLDDLGLVHTRGAFGAPAPLIDRLI